MNRQLKERQRAK